MSKRRKIRRIQLVRLPGQASGEMLTLLRRSSASGTHGKRSTDRANARREAINRDRSDSE